MRLIKALIGLVLAIVVFNALASVNSPNYQNQPTLNLNSNALGLIGPFSITGSYSSEYGPLVNTKYSTGLGPLDAILLELELGTNEYRLGATWGHQLTEKQRIKFTIEHLAQKINYNFFAGDERIWSHQNALGGSYQFLLDNSWLKTLDLNAYYAKADSKDLPSLLFANDTLLNIRRIAGATSSGASVGTNVQLWETGIINAAVNFDNLVYDAHYQPAQNVSGLGATLGIEQLLTDRVKLRLSHSYRKIYDETRAEIAWLANTKSNNRLEFGIQASRIKSHFAGGNDNRLGLTINYKWDQPEGSHAGYAAPAIMKENLTDWTSNPAVHMEQVLTMVDQKVEQVNSTLPLNKAQATDEETADTLIFHKGDAVNIPVQQYFSSSTNNSIISVSALPLGLHFNNKTNLIYGTIPDNSLGDYPIILTSNGVTHSKHKLLLEVVNPADAPIVKQQIPNQQATEGQLFQLPLDKNQLFTNPLAAWHNMTLSVSGIPANFTATPSNDVNLIAGTPNEQDVEHGTYVVTVTADNGFKTSQTFVLTIISAKPKFVGPDIQGHDGQENETYEPIDTANSFSGSGITYSVTGTALPLGLSLDPNTGIISGTPAAGSAGVYKNIVITATNSYGSASSNAFSITILDEKPSFKGPDIQGHEGQEGQTYEPIPTAASFTGDHLTFSANNLPPGLVIDANSGVISGTPAVDSAGIYNNIIVTASNNAGSAHSNAFSITISEAKPSFKGPDIQGHDGQEGQTYEPIATANSFTGGHLTFSTNNLPPGLSIDTNTGIISGTPTANSAGTYNNISVTASNKAGSATSNAFSITILDQKPSFKGPDIQGHEGQEEEAYAPISTASSFSGDHLTFSANNLPSGLVIDANTGVISGTPVIGSAGTYSNVTVTASNNAGSAVSNAFTITILSEKPSFKGPDIQGHQGQEGQTYEPISTAASFSGAHLTFSANKLPSGLAIDADTGIISGTPAIGSAGTYNNIIVTASNQEGSANSNAFPITILDAKPVFKGPDIQGHAGKEEQVYEPIATASAFTGNHLVFAANNLPPGLSINPSTGIISGTPASGSAGTYNNISVTASNNGGSATSNIFSITISHVLIGYLACPNDGSTRQASDGIKTYSFTGNGLGSWWQSNLEVNGTQATLTCYYRFRTQDTKLTTTITAYQISYANGSAGGNCTGSTDSCKTKNIY